MNRSYAINYFERNSYLSRKEIEWEVDQIITLPGRACTHTMGDLTLRRLKQKAQNQLGNALDICLVDRGVEAHAKHQPPCGARRLRNSIVNILLATCNDAG